MANPEHLKILKSGVESWNAWRRENPREPVDLSNADFDVEFPRTNRVLNERIDLTGINFGLANLLGPELTKWPCVTPTLKVPI